jgi:RNA polymerase sigma-70 factor (ECF subfamily)
MTADEQEQLFKQCLADHTNLMWRVARAFALSPHDQKDLLQEMAVQVWRSLPNFRGEAKTSTWIYRVAFNTALVWKRKELRRHARHERFVNCNVPEIPSPNAPVDAFSQEVVDQLYTAIRQLPKIDTSLALMHLDGLSYREMSDVVGLTEVNVGVKLTRIRKQLAEMLKGAHHEL